MTKPDSFINKFRNAIVWLICFVIACLVMLVFASVIFALLVEPDYLLKDPVDAILNLVTVDRLITYGFWWQRNFVYLKWDTDDYFVIKYLGSIAAPYLFLFTLIYSKRKVIYEKRPFKEEESQHGDAHWATRKDIAKAKLREKKGMMLGIDSQGYLVAGGYQHALLFAPTGSGKGVGFAIPNLLFWEDSVFVNDIKLENFELTSGWRKKIGQEIFVWNPANPDGYTHCYNPLDWISDKPGQMVDDVQKIANLILPKKEFWENEARTLFVGVVLCLIADPNKITSFGEVVRTLRSDDVVYNLATVLDTMGEVLHPVGYMNVAAFLQKADKERSGVVSTLNSGLELWANPLIDTATATSDFNIQEFKKKLTTVYVGVTPDNLKRLQPLLQVFYQQATEFLVRKMPGPDEPYGVMFLMDEFPTLGKMEQFMYGIAYFRGYRVRLFLIVQDTQQLKGIYEDSGMNSFLSNSTYRITFAANNVETAELISKLIGNKTIDQVSASKPKFLDFNPSARSLNVSKGQRALLLPQEVIALPRDEQIILIESSPPIKCKKIIYYEDKFFKKRLLKQIEVPKQEPYDPKFYAKKKAKDEEENSSENTSTEETINTGDNDEIKNVTKAPEQEYNFNFGDMSKESTAAEAKEEEEEDEDDDKEEDYNFNYSNDDEDEDEEDEDEEDEDEDDEDVTEDEKLQEEDEKLEPSDPLAEVEPEKIIEAEKIEPEKTQNQEIKEDENIKEEVEDDDTENEEAEDDDTENSDLVGGEKQPKKIESVDEDNNKVVEISDDSDDKIVKTTNDDDNTEVKDESESVVKSKNSSKGRKKKDDES